VLDPRTSTRLGAGLLAGAGALAVMGVLVRDPEPSPVTVAAPATAASAPATVATLPPVTESTATTTSSTPSSVDARPLVGTLPLSPLAKNLPPRVSARAVDASASAPAALWIGDLSLWAPILPVGFEPDGELEIPDEKHVGWYQFGSSPGRAGATVLAAHVSWNDTIGPFFRLAQLEVGAIVKLQLADGVSREYEVIERAQYDKQQLPVARIWTRAGPETLVLVTCGGDFDRRIHRYTDNIVVYAVPV
jgi:LPXTG-site transpeptidase (sortase) family protein